VSCEGQGYRGGRASGGARVPAGAVRPHVTCGLAPGPAAAQAQCAHELPPEARSLPTGRPRARRRRVRPRVGLDAFWRNVADEGAGRRFLPRGAHINPLYSGVISIRAVAEAFGPPTNPAVGNSKRCEADCGPLLGCTTAILESALQVVHGAGLAGTGAGAPGIRRRRARRSSHSDAATRQASKCWGSAG
jgi:hypothetical protein